MAFFSVVIPTYNEIESLPTALDRVREHAPEADILVVDDGSPDGTGDYADTRADEDSHIHVLHRSEKNGLGPAYLAGFAWGLERGYEVLVEMDADGSHPPERLPAMLEAVDGGADLAIGSRYVPGGSVVNWPWQRHVISRGGNIYSRVMLGVGIKDITAGYRAFRRTTLERIDLDGVESVGYCFQVDMAWRAVRGGLRVVEVPIEFVEREREAIAAESEFLGELTPFRRG